MMINRVKQVSIWIYLLSAALFVSGCSSSDTNQAVNQNQSPTTVAVEPPIFEPPQEPVSVDPLQVLPVKVKDTVYLRLTIAEDLLPLKTSRLIEMSLDEGATWSEISGEQENYLRSGQEAMKVKNIPEAKQHLFRISLTNATGEKIYSSATPAISSCEAPSGVIADLREKLNRSLAGIADYEDFVTADIPKSSAAILLAEVICLKSVATHDREFMDAVGNHLLDWPDKYPSEKFGWGLPFAWDAFGDGTENNPNTVYSISTGLVIKALLDWAEVSSTEVQNRVYEVVDKSLQEWVQSDSFTPLGQLAYSLSPYDNQLDVFNASAMLAGQMQRFSLLSETNQAKYEEVADQVMQSLLDNHRQEQIQLKLRLQPGQSLEELALNTNTDLQELLSSNGFDQDNYPKDFDLLEMPQNIESGWYWSYSSQETTPNDLTHAGYIVDGILSYVSNGGLLASQFDQEQISKHLTTFQSQGLISHELLGWPRWRLHELTKQEWRTPRLYDVGWSLYLSGELGAEIETLQVAACSDGLSYRQDGAHYLKYPRYINLDNAPNPEIHEYMAYFYLGQVNSPCGYSFDLLSEGSQTIPFVSIGHSSEKPIDVSVEANSHGSFIEVGENKYSLIGEGIPVDLVQTENHLLAIVRHWTSSSLEFISWNSTGHSETVTLPGQDSDLSLIFRGLAKDKDHLYIVVYDNAALENQILIYSQDNLEFLTQISLPSFEPEAGYTYEMEPPVSLLVNSSGNLEIFAGTLYATLVNGEIVENRLDGCSKILEAKRGIGSTIGVLCESNDYFEERWPEREGGFQLATIDETGLEWTQIETKGAPFNLRYDDIQKTFVWQDSGETDLSSFLRFEILNGQANGLLEFGVNNREGRISWSQIYYLNAFLDLLDGTIKATNSDISLDEKFSESLWQRLVLEIQALNQVLCIDGYESRPFTVNREPTTFAVQTSRIALLYERLINYVPSIENSVDCIKDVAESSATLENHIEVIAEEEIPGWLEAGTSYLKWPKGSAFYFDGLNVPYNHQNEWALGVLKLQDRFQINPDTVTAAEEILAYFHSQIVEPEGGKLPEDGRWPYWWGTASDGWTETAEISTNMPTYTGDTGDAWISFRSIDSFAMLEWSDFLDQGAKEKLVISLTQLIESGQVLPQVARDLPLSERGINFDETTIGVFGRASSPAEIPETVWIQAIAHH